MVKLGLLDRLAAGPVICAEGYLFELERRGYLQAGAYVPEVVLDFPEQVENLHRDFLRAGSDVIEAFTYYVHREKLRLIDRERDLEAINRAALAIAFAAAPGRTTFDRWLRPWVATRPPAVSRPTCPSTSCRYSSSRRLS
jgi:methionine synthase I (cobalamin-dependent)